MVTRLTGLSSGFDIDSWVTDLMKAERTKVDTQYQKKQTLEWKRDSYRSINTKLLALRTASFDLKLQGVFNSKNASADDSSLLTVTAGATAISGNYTVKINNMAASAAKSSTEALGSNSGATTLSTQFTGLTGDVTFTLEGKNGSKEFTFASATASINDVVKQINQANLGIKASYDSNTDRFYMMSTDTGATAKINITADAQNFLRDNLNLNTAAVIGTDASIDFNDATGLKFASNSFTLNGITINLKQSSGTTTISVSNNPDATVDKIKSFVEAYNNAVDSLNNEISAEHDRDYVPLTDAMKEEMSDTEIEKWESQAKNGLLRGDSLLRSVYNSVRSISYAKVEGLDGKYTTLSSVGISTASYSDKGKLYINETKLRAALAEDPEGVMNLFTQSSTTTSEKGLAVQFYDSVNQSMSKITNKAGSSSSTYDNSLIGKDLSKLVQRIDIMEDRLTDIEERYYKKFSAMEDAIQKFNSQSQYLSGFFNSGSSS